MRQTATIGTEASVRRVRHRWPHQSCSLIHTHSKGLIVSTPQYRVYCGSRFIEKDLEPQSLSSVGWPVNLVLRLALFHCDLLLSLISKRRNKLRQISRPRLGCRTMKTALVKTTDKKPINANEAAARNEPRAFCPECKQSVRLHRRGKTGTPAAHFEHLAHDKKCRLADQTYG
jgi:hypothetical protein